MNGEWLRKPKTNRAVVFVHGVLSDGEKCWRNSNGTCWPTLLEAERELAEFGIYSFTYKTNFFSGTYSLGDVVDSTKEHLRIDSVLECEHLIFVCHSMGGIVVRKFLVERSADIIERGITVGLFLVASPSLGSDYASWLKPLARSLGHAQADALTFSQSNTWLNDLDKEFNNLKASNRIGMLGKELTEDKFVFLPGILRKQVVEPFSGARYFGEPYKVPNSDHFSIAKPANAQAIQHRLLCDFLTAQTESAGETTSGELLVDAEHAEPDAAETVMMRRIGRFYRDLQSYSDAYITEYKLVVTANALRGRSEPDEVRSSIRMASRSGEVWGYGFRVSSADHKTILEKNECRAHNHLGEDVLAAVLPMTTPDDASTKNSPLLGFFFKKPITPGMEPYDINFVDTVEDFTAPLRDDGLDTFWVSSRITHVEKAEFVLFVPRGYGRVQLADGPKSSVTGKPLVPVRHATYVERAPRGFELYGWQCGSFEAGERFEVLVNRIPG